MTKRRSLKPVITKPNNPDGVAICDGCGSAVPYNDLKEQRDYRGGQSTVGLGYRHCSMCYDTPNAQLKAPLVKPDPVPFKNPRPDPQPTYGSNTEEELNSQNWFGA